MDDATKQKLTRLPVLGPAFERLLRSRPWAIYEHLDERHWTRLAAAVTFVSFLALFPVLALGAAVGSLLLTQDQMTDVERWFADQVPGISDALNLQALFDNAATIGVIALLLMVPTGVSWVGELRGCLRTVWDLPDPTENALLRKVKDLGVLAGLGLVMLLSLGTSALALNLVRHGARELGVTGAVGAGLLQAAAHLVAVGVTGLLIFYMLVWLPGVRPPRGATLAACLLGAAGFELLKALLSGYLTEIAGRNVYGVFGVPIALLIWINLMAKLLLFCCAWTATALRPEDRSAADALEGPEPPERSEPSNPPDRPERSERSEPPERSEPAERSERSEPPDRPA
jgi:membrane protein